MPLFVWGLTEEEEAERQRTLAKHAAMDALVAAQFRLHTEVMGDLAETSVDVSHPVQKGTMDETGVAREYGDREGATDGLGVVVLGDMGDSRWPARGLARGRGPTRPISSRPPTRCRVSPRRQVCGLPHAPRQSLPFLMAAQTCVACSKPCAKSARTWSSSSA